MQDNPEKPKKFAKVLLYTLLFLVFYLLTSIPLGIFVYTWKSEKGIDLFTTTGFHNFLGCMYSESAKAVAEEKKNINGTDVR